MKPILRRENRINEEVSKALKGLQEEKKKLKESIEFEFKFNEELKTEIQGLKSENDHLKRENERLIDIENRTRISNDNLWSLIEQQRTIGGWETPSEVTDSQPKVTDSRPQITDSRPRVTDSRPQLADSGAQVTDSQPQSVQNFENISTNNCTVYHEAKRRRPNNSWVDIWRSRENSKGGNLHLEIASCMK